MAHHLSSGLSVSGVNFVSSYCEDRAFAYDLTWPVKTRQHVAPATNPREAEPKLQAVQFHTTCQHPGWGSAATDHRCWEPRDEGSVRGVRRGSGRPTRVQRLRLSRALGCWESGVESTQP